MSQTNTAPDQQYLFERELKYAQILLNELDLGLYYLSIDTKIASLKLTVNLGVTI